MRRSEAKILVVDDSQAMIRYLTGILEGKGYRVITAVDGLEAINKAEEYHPELILLDILMPNLNGYETCRRLKSKEKTKDIPVIMVTSQGSPFDIKWGRKVGADGYITKPFEEGELLKEVKEKLCRRK